MVHTHRQCRSLNVIFIKILLIVFGCVYKFFVKIRQYEFFVVLLFWIFKMSSISSVKYSLEIKVF